MNPSDDIDAATEHQPGSNNKKPKKPNRAIKLLSFVVAALLFISGVTYVVIHIFSMDGNNQPTDSPSVHVGGEDKFDPQSSDMITSIGASGVRTVSYANINDQEYLKLDVELYDQDLRYCGDNLCARADSPKLVSGTSIYKTDEEGGREKVSDLDYTNHDWTFLQFEPIYRLTDQPEERVSDRILSFKTLPKSGQVMFVVDSSIHASETDEIGSHFTSIVSERVVYLHEINDVGSTKQLSMKFDRESADYSYPRVESISDDERYVSLSLYGCWNCGGHTPETIVINTLSNEIDNIGQVLNFSWRDSGSYEYKEYVSLGPCEEHSFERPCIEDPENLPLQTGEI